MSSSSGLKITLETRNCPKCNRQFRVLPSSPQYVCSDECGRQVARDNGQDTRFGFNKKKEAPLSLDEMERMADEAERKKKIKLSQIKVEKKVEPVAPVKKKEITPEEKWQSYISRAKRAVSDIAKARIDIADLAIEACDIIHGGGGHWSGHEGVYTLKRFSEDVGIPKKTLQNWVRVRRLSLKLNDFEPEKDWQALVLASGKLCADDSPEKIAKEFKKWRTKKDEFNQVAYLLQCSRRVKSTIYFLENKFEFREEDREALEELKMNCSRIVKLARSFV